MTKRQVLQEMETAIFNTVYQWGHIGIETDQDCPAFKSLMRKYRKEIRKQA